MKIEIVNTKCISVVILHDIADYFMFCNVQFSVVIFIFHTISELRYSGCNHVICNHFTDLYD